MTNVSRRKFLVGVAAAALVPASPPTPDPLADVLSKMPDEISPALLYGIDVGAAETTVVEFRFSNGARWVSKFVAPGEGLVTYASVPQELVTGHRIS